MPDTEAPIIGRFYARVDRSAGIDACHSWLGPKRNRAGYGAFVVNGRTEVAHRWLLSYLRGRPLVWPAEIACHRCDNPSCCNPAHIYVGDHSGNAVDAIERLNHGAVVQRAKTHCPQGHPYDAENVRFSAGRRYCAACKRTKSNESHKRARRDRGLKHRIRLEDGRFAWVDAVNADG